MDLDIPELARNPDPPIAMRVAAAIDSPRIEIGQKTDMGAEAPVPGRLEPRLELAVERRPSAGAVIGRIIESSDDGADISARIDLGIFEAGRILHRRADLRTKQSGIDRHMLV